MGFVIRCAVFLTLILSGPVQAQGLFSPVVTVNEAAITGYEIDQRIKLLTAFRTSGDLNRIAVDQLIEDRLKQQELGRAGARLDDAVLQQALDDFASRANLDYTGFVAALAEEGVAEQTIRDFVAIGTAWRELIRARYLARTQVTEAEVDRAIGQASGAGSGIQVLVSEIILAAPPEQLAAATAIAEEITSLTTAEAFSDYATRYSALASRDNGGRLDWLPITNFPAAIRGVILSLKPGEVTTPIPIDNGIALFQLRAAREMTQTVAAPSAIDYAIYYIPGGRSPEALATAARVTAETDSCDDLYGTNYGQPPERLARQTQAPADIPHDIALELARLDAGETSTGLVTPDGQTLMLVMMCGRTAAAATAVDREEVRNQIRGARLAGFADALLADLMAAATIIR